MIKYKKHKEAIILKATEEHFSKLNNQPKMYKAQTYINIYIY